MIHTNYKVRPSKKLSVVSVIYTVYKKNSKGYSSQAVLNLNELCIIFFP